MTIVGFKVDFWHWDFLDLCQSCRVFKAVYLKLQRVTR